MVSCAGQLRVSLLFFLYFFLFFQVTLLPVDVLASVPHTHTYTHTSHRFSLAALVCVLSFPPLFYGLSRILFHQVVKRVHASSVPPSLQKAAGELLWVCLSLCPWLRTCVCYRCCLLELARGRTRLAPPSFFSPAETSLKAA